MIKHEGDKWILYTKDGSRKLGTHDTEEGARAQERAIEALKHRAAGDHDPESARHLHLRGALGAPRTEQLDGRPHLVVPVVALMEGVIHAVNAKTPERVTAQTLARAAHSWNGRPLVFGHPTKGGRQCSANEPAIMATHAFGTVYNSRVEGTKLLMDAYVDIERATRVGGERFLEDLRAGKVCEVSVGAYVATDAMPGTHNGKPYKATWLETVGDHLAFLPGGRGACSIEMGCGAHRAAMHVVTEEGLEAEMPKKLSFVERVAGALRAAGLAEGEDVRALEECPHLGAMGMLLGESKRLLSEAQGYVGEMQEYDETDVGKLEALETLAMTMTTMLNNVVGLTYKKRFPTLPAPSSPTYLEAFRAAIGREISAKNMKAVQGAHDASHEMHDRTTALGAACNGMRLLEVSIDGTRLTAPVVAALASLKKATCETCDGTGQVKEDDKQRDCPSCEGRGYLKTAEGSCGCKGDEDMTKADRVAALLKNEHNPLKDEKGLLASDDKAIEALEAHCKNAATLKAAADKDAADKKTAEEKAAADLKAAEDAKKTEVEKLTATIVELKAASEKTLTEDEFLKRAPESIRTLVADKKAQDAAQKAALVGQLKTAAAGTFTEEELNAKSLPELMKLAQLAKVETPDYSGRATPRVPRDASKNFAPPDPYKRDLEALQGKAVN